MAVDGVICPECGGLVPGLMSAIHAKWHDNLMVVLMNHKDLLSKLSEKVNAMDWEDFGDDL